MGRRNDHSREQLEEMIVEAAEELIAESGLPGLSMRKVAKAIGYTVGTLYLIFRNQDTLLFALNRRTLDKLHTELDKAISAAEPEPEARLQSLAIAYIHYAESHRHRWLAAFEHRPEGDAPDWLEERINRLFGLVLTNLKPLMPNADEQTLRAASTSLWSGVHGICILKHTNKLDYGGLDSAENLASFLVTTMVRGLRPA